MDQRNISCSFVLIDENGKLNVDGLKTFGKEVKMAEGGVPYAAISIMGSQSSGKSTLQNHLFGTNFTEMDAHKKRGATTQGIWLAKSPNFDKCILVMDLEGSDGNERGEDGTKFEKQAALFAFAISDIVLINMWSHSVGCMHAANMSLLRTVFEARRKLNLRDSRTTLWFVLRDTSSPTTKAIKKRLRDDIEGVWNLVATGTPLSNSFEVNITFLPHYEHKRRQFEKKVDNLREKLLGELTKNGKMHPPSEFPKSVRDLWKDIKKNKDLDLPAFRVMLATARCEDIAKKMFSSFNKNKGWSDLKSGAQSGQFKDFWKKLDLILKEHLSKYDTETEYYDEGVRTEKKSELRDKMMKCAEPSWETILDEIHSQTLDEFIQKFRTKFRGKPASDRAVRRYTNIFMAKFDEKWRGIA